MNILISAKIFAQSGVGAHICTLAQGLTDAGQKVFVAAGSNEHPQFLQQHGIDFLPLSFSLKPAALCRNLRLLRRYITENHIDVVHCHHRSCAVYMQLLSKFTGTPFVWTNHADDIPHDFLHRVTTFYGARAICVSTELKQFCVEQLKIPPEKIAVVYNGICPENYAFSPEDCAIPRDEKLNITLFARMAPIKGHLFLLAAVAALPAEKREKIRLIFTGGTDGDYAQAVRQRAADLGLSDTVAFVGFLSPERVLPFSDLSVLPSRAEGFGIAVLESFLYGVPVIRTKTGGWQDVKNYCTGVEYGDVPALTQALSDFIDGGDITEQTARAKAFVLAECTRRHMTDRLLNIYREALLQAGE